MTDDPNPAGNPMLAAATEAIMTRRLTSVHWSDSDTEAHRAALLPGALLDAAAVLDAVTHLIRTQATATERERIIALASQLRAAIPADHPVGAQASFADYLRVTAPGEAGNAP